MEALGIDLQSWVKKPFSSLEEFASIMAKISMFIMVFSISIDAVLRYTISSTLPGVYALTELILMPLFVFGIAGKLQKNDGNISVDILNRKLSTSSKFLVNIISGIGALLVFGPMAWFTFNIGLERYQQGAELTGTFPLPTSSTWFIIASGLVILSIRLIVQVKDNIISLKSGSSEDSNSKSIEQDGY